MPFSAFRYFKWLDFFDLSFVHINLCFISKYLSKTNEGRERRATRYLLTSIPAAVAVDPKEQMLKQQRLPILRPCILLSLFLVSFLSTTTATEVYHDSFALGFSTRPMIRFVQPVQDSLVLSGKLTVQVVVSPPDLQMNEMDLFFCIELIYRHGHERRCYLDVPLPWTATIDGLQAGRMQILATLEHNTTVIDPTEDNEQIGSITIAKTQVGFDVAETSLSPTMQITYPRPKEHLSTKDVDVAMRIGNFLPSKKNIDDDQWNEAGYFCVTFVQDIGDPKKERKHNKCIVPDTTEVVMSALFHNGVHAVSARLYSKNGKPMNNKHQRHQLYFVSVHYRPRSKKKLVQCIGQIQMGIIPSLTVTKLIMH